MTTITDTMRTVAGDPDNSEVVFFVPEMRPAASGTATVTMKRVPITPVNGAFSVTLDPGLVYAQIGSGRSPFVVPASGTARMGTLIAQYLPPTSTPTQVDAAITAWLEDNPLPGGGLTVDQIATAATTSTPLKTALDNSYAPIWQASTAYAINAPVILPNGKPAIRTAAGTSRAQFDATELALWTITGGGLTQAQADELYGGGIKGAEADEIRDGAAEAVALSRNAVYSSVQDALGSQLVFEKSATNPIFRTADTPLPSIYWPSVMNVEGKLPNPLGKYYLWYSTDHGQANGRIALATADSLTGPWTQRGVVWQYSTSPGGSGSESETPSVVWDYANERFIMYHQQVGPTGAVAAQVTMGATSPDGLAWTSIGIVLDVRNANDWRAPLHTGYFRAFYVGNGYVGYSLMQGQESPSFGIWRSPDGLKWHLDPRPLGYGSEYLPDTMRVEWNTSNVVLWRGQYLWIGLVSSFASGAEGRRTYYAVAQLSDDLRSFKSAPQKLFDKSQAWESLEAGQGHAFVDEGRLVIAYRSGNGTVESPFGFGVAYSVPATTSLHDLSFAGEVENWSLQRDPTGRIIPAGRVGHSQVWDPAFIQSANLTALPDWVTVPNGTWVQQNMVASTNPPQIKLTTTAAVDGAARLKIQPDIIPTNYEEIVFWADGLKFDADDTFDFRWEIGGTSQDRGIDYRQNSGQIGGRFRTHITNSTTFVDRPRAPYFSKTDGAGRKPTNFALRWRPHKREAYICMDDQVVAAMRYDAAEMPALTTAVSALFTLNTKTATARTVIFNRIGLSLFHN